MDFFAGLPEFDTMGRPVRRQDPAERLHRQLERVGDCLEFQGNRSPLGYGRMSVAGWGVLLAHRVAWMVAHDMPIPAALWVLHSCDNPPCCNPDHLRLGTPADNSADMVRRGRTNPMCGTDSPRLKYDDATVQRVRELSASGMTSSAVAEVTGVPADYVSKLARGDRRSQSAPGPLRPKRTGEAARRLPYARIAREYAAGATTIEIAERYGTYPGNISRIVRSQGVATRLPGRTRRRAS